MTPGGKWTPLMKRTVRDESGAWSLLKNAPVRASETASSSAGTIVAEIARHLGGSGRAFIHGQDTPKPVDHGDGHRIGLSGRGRGLHQHHDVALRERLRRRVGAEEAAEPEPLHLRMQTGRRKARRRFQRFGRKEAAELRWMTNSCDRNYSYHSWPLFSIYSRSTRRRGDRRSRALCRLWHARRCNEFIKKTCSSGSNRVR